MSFVLLTKMNQIELLKNCLFNNNLKDLFIFFNTKTFFLIYNNKYFKNYFKYRFNYYTKDEIIFFITNSKDLFTYK